MSEAQDIGWEFSGEDIAQMEREREDRPNEFEAMLAYHEIDEQDWADLSRSQRDQHWWNYRKLGATP